MKSRILRTVLATLAMSTLMAGAHADPHHRKRVCHDCAKVTGVRVVSTRVARDVLSIMSSCGMYDYSGEWLLRVGLPAKSGVSGGLLAVAPSQFGVAAFSPRLDAHGNSVRAIAAVETVSDRFDMHLLESHENVAVPALRIERTGEGRVVRLGGELGFSGTERVIGVLREIAASVPDGTEVVVDASELARTHPAALMALRAEFEVMPEGFRLAE